MPFTRGASAIIEWFERFIYEHFGYVVAYNDERSTNLEALALNLPQFVEEYDNMIKLTKKNRIY